MMIIRLILILSRELRRGKRAVLVPLLLAIVGVSCGEAAGGEEDRRQGLLVVATTSIHGDIVSRVVGHAGTVEVLMPIGADPHDFQPSARQVALIGAADLVVVNGLELEEGLLDVLDSLQGARVLELAPLLDPLPLRQDELHDDDYGDLDPHVWLDPVRIADGVQRVGRRLAELDGGEQFVQRAASYREQLLSTHQEVRATLEQVPPGRRKLVTNHETLAYFADRYRFEVVGTVIPGGATVAEPSARQLARLAELVEAEDVPAIFVETTAGAALAEAVAQEVGHQVEVVTLFTESLGEPGSGADSYLGLLRTNAERIAGALG
ncbi:MAG: metal ABC transporter substrate-binding protein [Actinomycetota bacterium]|nr:metal ABC transporter substrate-binding protein [Actinomycetota bacterium]